MNIISNLSLLNVFGLKSKTKVKLFDFKISFQLCEITLKNY